MGPVQAMRQKCQRRESGSIRRADSSPDEENVTQEAAPPMGVTTLRFICTS
ncbi:hypothetical protein EC919_103456 [Pseudomonas graminis]|nr:hypothetical protein EC919_103456 [Pseudomonas graminis]